MSLKRYIPFVLLNVLISAAVVLAALYYWDQRQTEQRQMATATSVAATAPVATAAAVATASSVPPTLVPTPSQITHVVVAGDTLGTIAEEYNVPMQDIIDVNNITNPNILSVGTELVIPIGGIPTDTPEPTAVPTSAEPPTPIATDPPDLGEAEPIIQDILHLGDLENEAVVIANQGSRRLQLAGWQVEDSQGNVYVFQPFVLFGNGAVVVLHTDRGDDSATALYWGLTFSVWESGETATLRDPDGIVRASFTAP